jgi:hypothetical protein
MKVPTSTFFQSAYIVSDLHSAMRRWHETHGAGPCLFSEHVTLGPDCFTYRDTPGSVRFDLALCHFGQFQLELIAPCDDAPSAFRDVYRAGEEGFHHLATIAAAFDTSVAHYKTRGYDVVQSGNAMGVRFCYFDARRDFGCMIEVIDDVPLTRTMSLMMEAATKGWNGEDPYRPLTLPP